MRPEFEIELVGILKQKEREEQGILEREVAIAAKEKEFTQQFQELLKTLVLPQFEHVVDLLSENYYPAEVNVFGGPGGEKGCYLTFAIRKMSDNWALKGGKIIGPRMAFQAQKSGQRVIYFANYNPNSSKTTEQIMSLGNITMEFLEQEIRHLFEALQPMEDQFSPSSEMRSVV